MELLDTAERKILGYLYENDEAKFVYCCSQCDLEFDCGTKLENHTFTHIDIKIENHPVECEDESQQTVKSDYWTTPTSLLKQLRVRLSRLSPESFQSASNSFEIEKSAVNELDAIDEFDYTNDIEADDREEDWTKHDIISENSKKSSPKQSITRIQPQQASSSITRTQPKSRSKNTTDSTYIQSSSSTVFQCEICSKKFAVKHRLNQHMISHYAKTPCTICGKVVRKMKEHMFMHDRDKRAYKCNFCTATFAVRGYLKIHERKHTDQRDFVCSFCGRAFHAIGILTSHIRKTHEQVKPHECDKCDRRFQFAGQLRAHFITRHTRQRPVACEQCDKRFPTKDRLRKHKFVHGEPTFACKLCDSKFKHWYSRREHEINIHKAV